MKTLILPDLHQNVEACKKALKRHSSNHDKIIFLGDYFDCFDFQPHISVEKTCEFLWDTYNELGDKGIWLAGNHDIPYLEELYFKGEYARSGHYFSRERKRYTCTGYTKNKADKIRHFFLKENRIEFWDNLKLFHKDDRFIYSHAGFAHSLFKPHVSLNENLLHFESQWDTFFDNLKTKNTAIPFPENFIWDVGQCRGGDTVVGGPLWLDWYREFVHVDGIDQMVGHTIGDHVRNLETSYCIDTHHKHCASVDKNGDVMIYDI